MIGRPKNSGVNSRKGNSGQRTNAPKRITKQSQFREQPMGNQWVLWDHPAWQDATDRSPRVTNGPSPTGRRPRETATGRRLSGQGELPSNRTTKQTQFLITGIDPVAYKRVWRCRGGSGYWRNAGLGGRFAAGLFLHASVTDQPESRLYLTSFPGPVSAGLVPFPEPRPFAARRYGSLCSADLAPFQGPRPWAASGH